MTSRHEKPAHPTEEYFTRAQDDPPKQAAGKDSGPPPRTAEPRYTWRHQSLAYTPCHAIVPCPRLHERPTISRISSGQALDRSLASDLHSMPSRCRRSGRTKRKSLERRDTRWPRELTIESIKGQVRVISRIIRDQVMPVVTHVVDLSSGPGDLLLGIVAAARGGFVVIQHGVWRPDHDIARLPDAKAEINIVECDGEITFIQSTQSPIQGSSDDEARTGYG